MDTILYYKGWKTNMSKPKEGKKKNKKFQENSQIHAVAEVTPVVSDNAQNSVSDNVPTSNNKYTIKEIIEMAGIIVAILVSVVGVIIYFVDMHGDIKDLNEQYKKVDTMYDYIYVDEGGVNDQLDDITDRLDNLETGIEEIKEALNIKVVSVTEENISAIDNAAVHDSPQTSTAPAFTTNVLVGTDTDGTSYYVEDLINQLVLFTYQENNQEIYFLGQYNKNYNWHGYCVTNAYNLDGTLYGICESNFNNGKRLNYKSFYKDSGNQWILSERECSEDGNVGTSIHYDFTYDKIKNFTSTNVRRPDILYVDRFVNTYNPQIVKFYSGKTSDEKYNDDTGKAYLVKYTKDGFVKTIYQGKFKDGQFHDDTNNAWSIDKWESTDKESDNPGHYMFYKGQFKNGEKAKNKGYDFENYLTQSHIDNILKNVYFECETPFDEKAIVKED